MSVGRIVVILSLVWSSASACNRNEDCALNESDTNVMGLLTSMDYFTTQFIQKFIYDPESKTNIIISPMSLYVLLALVIFGSAGDTQKELIAALKFPEGDMAELQKCFGDIVIMTDRKRSKVVEGKEYIAVEGLVKPGLFVQKEFTFVEDYTKYLDLLHVKINLLDFVNDMAGATTEINRWIEEGNPKSKLPPMEYIINKDIKIYLTSLFYLTAKWKENLFLDIPPAPAPFETLSSGPVDVQMMKTISSLDYYEKVDVFTAVGVPLEGEDFMAIFFLPKKGTDAAKFATTFTKEMVEEFSTKAEPKNIDCQIPIFSYEYPLELNTQLQEWGVKLLFETADLSKMLKMDPQKFGVQVSHSSEITINELGVSPESLLKIDPVPKTAPTEDIIPFVANSPFMMIIRSSHSRAIVSATFFYKV